MRSEAQKAARRLYEASEKGKEAKRRHEAAYKASGGRATAEARRKNVPLSEARRAARTKWAKNNQTYFTAMRSYRRTLEKALDPFEFWVLQEAVSLARLRETVVGGRWHVDHIVPLKSKIVCGLHCSANLQVIPAIINSSKGNRVWPDMP